jgi:hypothetical protein
VALPVPGLSDGAFVGVLDTMARALEWLDLSADGWCRPKDTGPKEPSKIEYDIE